MLSSTYIRSNTGFCGNSAAVFTSRSNYFITSNPPLCNCIAPIVQIKMADDEKGTFEEIEEKLESVFERTKEALHHAADKANEFVHLAVTAEKLPDAADCEPILDEEDKVKMGLEWRHGKQRSEEEYESRDVEPPVEYEYDKLFDRAKSTALP